MVRVVSYDSMNDFVFRSGIGSGLAGICVDLWDETARQLNLTYSLEMVERWPDMFENFNQNRSDIIMQRIDEFQLKYFNATE